jgi:hypothetical protein
VARWLKRRAKMSENRLSYERLEHITKTNKPYRGTENEFPLTKRAHSYKRFIRETDAKGDAYFRIIYGYRYVDRYIDKAEYDEAQSKNLYVRVETQADNSVKYIVWDRYWDDIGIVRKDNTFELTATNLHQGTRHFIGAMFNNWMSAVISSVRHGGAIYKEITGSWSNQTVTKVIPLFKGQRINLDTNSSVLDYEVHLSKVNRTRTKQIMAEYIEPLQFNEVMFKTMSPDAFISSLQETYAEAITEGERWRSNNAMSRMLSYARDNVKVDMFKTICATMMASHYRLWSYGSEKKGSTNYGHDRNTTPHDYYLSARKKIDRQIKIGANALDSMVYKANEPYPSNTWDVTVIHNGNVVKQY